MRRLVIATAVLWALAAAGCSSVQIKKEQATQVALRQVRQALDLYRMDHGRYPGDEEGLALLVNPGGGKLPYLKELPPDPWGTPYRYRLADDGPIVDSAGPDRRHGTADDLSLKP